MSSTVSSSSTYTPPPYTEEIAKKYGWIYPLDPPGLLNGKVKSFPTHGEASCINAIALSIDDLVYSDTCLRHDDRHIVRIYKKKPEEESKEDDSVYFTARTLYKAERGLCYINAAQRRFLKIDVGSNIHLKFVCKEHSSFKKIQSLQLIFQRVQESITPTNVNKKKLLSVFDNVCHGTLINVSQTVLIDCDELFLVTVSSIFPITSETMKVGLYDRASVQNIDMCFNKKQQEYMKLVDDSEVSNKIKEEIVQEKSTSVKSTTEEQNAMIIAPKAVKPSALTYGSQTPAKKIDFLSVQLMKLFQEYVYLERDEMELVVKNAFRNREISINDCHVLNYQQNYFRVIVTGMHTIDIEKITKGFFGACDDINIDMSMDPKDGMILT